MIFKFQRSVIYRIHLYHSTETQHRLKPTPYCNANVVIGIVTLLIGCP